MDDGVGGEDDDDDNGDYDGTIMMTTMTMRMINSRNIHPPQPRVGKEGSGRHLRYLILLQPAGDGGVLFVFLFHFRICHKFYLYLSIWQDFMFSLSQ